MAQTAQELAFTIKLHKKFKAYHKRQRDVWESYQIIDFYIPEIHKRVKASIFEDSRFNYRCTHKTNFEKTNGPKSEYCSFYRYEMFDLIMTDKQQKFIDDLANKAPIGSDYVFASSTDIKNGLSLGAGQFIQFLEYIKKLV